MGWDDPASAPDEATNGALDLTAIIDTGKINSEAWVTASACRVRPLLTDENEIAVVVMPRAVNATVDGMLIIYLLAPNVMGSPGIVGAIAAWIPRLAAAAVGLVLTIRVISLYGTPGLSEVSGYWLLGIAIGYSVVALVAALIDGSFAVVTAGDSSKTFPCPRCSSPLPENSRFCGRCGLNMVPKSGSSGFAAPTSLPPQAERICRRCGGAYPPNIRFCGRCGQSMG